MGTPAPSLCWRHYLQELLVIVWKIATSQVSDTLGRY
jgi:hypothetical protein